MKKTLITGCCGHIGSYFIDQIVKYDSDLLGDYVVGIDNMKTQRYCSLFGMLNTPRFKFVQGDFADLTEEQLSEYDTIIHLAAITDAANSFNNAEETEKINVEQTKEFIRKAEKSTNLKQFFFPSSTSVYGVASDDVVEDDENYLNPQSPYAESKIKIEKFIKEETGLPYIILRFGTIFGISNGMRFHTAINKFCWQAAMREDVTVWKDNFEMHRPYLGLDDALQSIVLLMDQEVKDEEYNVITNNFKLVDIINFIARVMDGDFRIDFVNTPLLNQYSYKVNIDKIKKLGYAPFDSLEEGINRTLKLLGVQKVNVSVIDVVL